MDIVQYVWDNGPQVAAIMFCCGVFLGLAGGWAICSWGLDFDTPRLTRSETLFVCDFVNEELFFHGVSEVNPKIIRDALDSFNSSVRS